MEAGKIDSSLGDPAPANGVFGEEGVESEDEDANGITSKKLKYVERKLGLVRLSWQEEGGAEGAQAYASASDIEKALFWLVENFRRQFRSVYPNRKPLPLTCPNECDVQKFVSTSIRRSLLPYAEFSTWQGCASFVSDYFAYEPFREPCLLPKHLHSPTHILKTQRANSFELATFLVSILLGAGYNAYVVNGYASREQCQYDQTKLSCPYLPEPEEAPPPEPKLDTTRYRPKTPPDFRSKFLQQIEARKKRKEEKDLIQREEQRQRMIMELERPAADRLFGQRIHAWVVLLPDATGARSSEITEPFFIEPSTGKRYEPHTLDTMNVYLGIESIWNDRNYWVNFQDCSEACSKLQWDLTDLQRWEHLLPGEPSEMRKVDDDEDEEVNIRREFHMVMPCSYVDCIELPYENYERRYPNGCKTIYYKKAKVELFAPYLREDGLVQSITTFEDYEYKLPYYVYEKFENREDFLERTEKHLKKETITDYYAKGRADACKIHQYFINSKGIVDEERTLEFYESKRLDDLSRIQMSILYASHDYKLRDDLLYNRFVEYSPFSDDNDEKDIHYRMIIKIVEKFHRNEKISASKEIDTREFDFVDNEMRLTYHYKEGEYTQATRTFLKPPADERGDLLVFSPEMTYGYNPDSLAPPPDFDDLVEELEKQLKEEDTSVFRVRQIESEMFNFLQVRASQFSKPKLNISMFDPIRNHEARAGLLAEEKKMKEQSEREVEQDVDFLSPYFARFGNLKYLTKNQAIQIENDCLKDFKEILVARANKILEEIKKRNDEMEQLQSTLTKSEGLTKEEKEQLFDRIGEMDLKIRALEVRLNRHRELVSEKYHKLVDFVRHNRKISILFDE